MNSDRQRWNTRYQQYEKPSIKRPRKFLLENAAYLPQKGLALDVAMGLGGNAGFLLARGLRVIGVDISEIALRRAYQRLPELFPVQADLRHFSLPDRAVDVILNFYYLERSLWPFYHRALKPGGILVFETMTQDMSLTHPEIDPVYLLAPGELCQAFSKLEILVYREETINEDGRQRPVASLVARCP